MNDDELIDTLARRDLPDQGGRFAMTGFIILGLIAGVLVWRRYLR